MDQPVNVRPQPRYPVIPLRAGVIASEIALDSDYTSATDQPLIGTRVIVNPGDDVAAANALLTGAGCEIIQPGEALTIESDSAITAVYMVAIGNAAIPADYAGGTGVISINETDLADVTAQMIRLDFSDRDNVRSVTIGMFDSWASGLAGRLYVKGHSHA